MIFCIAFVLMGMIYGSIVGVMFCQMDSKWKTMCSVGTGGLISSFIVLYKYFQSSITFDKIYLFVCFVASMMVTAIVVIILCSNGLKKKYTLLKFNYVDLIFGRKKVIDDYYKNAQKFATMDYENKKEELVNLEKQNKDREKELNSKEENINSLQKKIDSEVGKHLHIKLPIEKYIIIDNEFISELPTYISNLTTFIHELEDATKQCINEYENPKKPLDDKEFIISFFRMLCLATSVYLFDTLKDVRTHIRYLSKDNKYKKLVASIGNTEERKPLKLIPLNKGMIYKAGQNKVSMVKSVNEDCHYRGNNDDVWKDYITMVFSDFYDNNKPFISLGISIKDLKYKNFLYFLNYCKIETIFQKYVLQIQEKCNIINKLKEYDEVA